MKQIEIKEEFKKLIPALTTEEYKQLEDNCLEEGIREKIILWNNYIIDGHNRYNIAKQWNLEFETESKNFNSEVDVKIWMACNQLGRRNLMDFVKGELYSTIEELEKEKGKKNIIEAQKERHSGVTLSTIDKDRKQRTFTQNTANKVGVTLSTIDKDRKPISALSTIDKPKPKPNIWQGQR